MNLSVWDKIKNNSELSKTDAVSLLNINAASGDYFKLLSLANERSRRLYSGKGYVFAQIGLNAEPCGGNCKFCSFAKDNYSVDSNYKKSPGEIISQAYEIAASGIDALFLMTTADYDKNEFLTIGEAIRAVLPETIMFVANIGDFNLEYARKLKETGFTGAYHVVRLREGIDTDIKTEARVATLDAIKAAGLELLYCVEPIGAEHTYEEIADEMIRAKNYSVDIMAVMGRVAVKGTPYESRSELSEYELAKIAAVAGLVTNPKKSMNIHEPKITPMLAGVNQLYAEIGSNPRDTKTATENNRGYDIFSVKKLLRDAGWTTR